MDKSIMCPWCGKEVCLVADITAGAYCVELIEYGDLDYTCKYCDEVMTISATIFYTTTKLEDE